LRKDIHARFDAHLVSIDPQTHQIVIAANLRGTEYARFEGKPLRLPAEEADTPDVDAFARHYKTFKAKKG
jgi:hypothetical protein